MNLPKHGKVCILDIADKQFGNMKLFHGIKKKSLPQPEQQLQLF